MATITTTFNHEAQIQDAYTALNQALGGKDGLTLLASRISGISQTLQAERAAGTLAISFDMFGQRIYGTTSAGDTFTLYQAGFLSTTFTRMDYTLHSGEVMRMFGNISSPDMGTTFAGGISSIMIEEPASSLQFTGTITPFDLALPQTISQMLITTPAGLRLEVNGNMLLDAHTQAVIGNATQFLFSNGTQAFSASGLWDMATAPKTTDIALLTVWALAGDDTIAVTGSGGFSAFGYEGNDSISGGAGNDSLYGGGGRDTLSGGAGSDVFAVSDISAIDQIVDFEAGVDRLQLDDAIFRMLGTGGLAPWGWGPSAGGANIVAASHHDATGVDATVLREGESAQDANDYLIYNSATGALYYDADGNGSGAVVQFASLSIGSALTAADINVS